MKIDTFSFADDLSQDPSELTPANERLITIKEQAPKRWVRASVLGCESSVHFAARTPDFYVNL